MLTMDPKETTLSQATTWSNCRRHGARILRASPQLVLVIWLFSSHLQLNRLIAIGFAADLIAVFMPWKPPRRTWNATRYWLETLSYLAPYLVASYAIIVEAPKVLTSRPSPIWIGLGIGNGIALLVVAGTPVRMIVNGDIAALLGPDKRSHATARATQMACMAFAEEVVFRGGLLVVLTGEPISTDTKIEVALLGSAVFILRHHIIDGSAETYSIRRSIAEIAAAASLGTLALVSGSIWPTITAHVMVNAPMVVLEIQRTSENDERATSA